MLKRKGKIVSLVLTSLLCIALLAGCAGQTNQKDETGIVGIASQSSENTLTIATGGELTTLSPLYMVNTNLPVSKLVYEGLVKYVDGKVEPSLAESWSFNTEGTELTFKLRQNVTFHDGEKFNAEAVKANLDFWHTNESYVALKAISNIVSIDVIDEYTVKIIYPNPYFAYETDFCWPDVCVFVSPKVIIPGDFQTVKGVVGTGPYKYEELVSGKYTKFVKNENYWGEEPAYDEIIAKYIPDSASRIQSLKTGEVDLIFGLGLISYEDYNQATSIEGIEGKLSELDVKARNMTLNLTSEKLSSLKVRQAIACAIDKEKISKGLTYGYEPVADSVMMPSAQFGDITITGAYKKDVEKAIALLEEDGWKLNADGIREKDGKKLSLDFTFDSGDTAMSKSIITLIKGQLAKIGIEVNIKGQEKMEWFMGCLQGQFDMTLFSGHYDYSMPNCFFTPMTMMTSQTVSLPVLDESEKFTDLIKEFESCNDEERLREIFTYLVNYDLKTVLDIPLTFCKSPILYNSSKVKGYNFVADPDFFDIFCVEPNK